MGSTVLAGSTGLVGAQILRTLLAAPEITEIHTVTRRAPSTISSKLHNFTSEDTSLWSNLFSSVSPPPAIFFSALGATKASAGSVAAQRLIDYDLNLSLAAAAKQAGVKIYVLISVSSASSSSYVAYSKMKGELEDAIKGLGFDTTVFLRPGLLLGERQDSRPAEAIVKAIANFIGSIFGTGAIDSWAQDVEVVGRAAVSASLLALQGGKGQVWVLNQADILRLGRTEWKG